MTIGSPASSRILPGEHLERLRSAIRGRVVLPRDPGWDAARRAWQLLVDQRSVAVVEAADVDDIVTTVALARRLGLHVAPQGTGHGAGTIPSLEDTILLRTGRLNRVDLDLDTESARVEAGAVWADVAAAAAPHGLAAVAGMAPSVGVVGFALGGGLGWLARSHGLAANSVRAIEAVDAHGRIVRIDAVRNADLFWAARGGFAPVVVTAIEVQLYAIDELHAGALMWPLERAGDVAHAWRRWVADVPETVTSLLRILRYPPIPEIPEPLRGRSFVAVEAALQEDAAATSRLLDPLRALGPELDSVRAMPPAELAAVHGDPPQPSPAHGEAVALSEISPDAVDALLDAALRPESAPLLSIELRHLGGRLAPAAAGGGAVSAIDAAGLVYAVGIVPFPEAREPVRLAASAVVERLDRYAAPTVVKNFAESPVPARALFGDATERLRRVAAAWDPERIIRIGHPLD